MKNVCKGLLAALLSILSAGCVATVQQTCSANPDGSVTCSSSGGVVRQ